MASNVTESRANSGATDGATAAQRVPLLRPESGEPYGAWRPKMETFMMRAGVYERDYKMPLPGWKELAAAADQADRESELEAMAFILAEVTKTPEDGVKAEEGGNAPSASSAKMAAPSTGAPLTKEQLEKRRVVAGIVARSKTAYAYLWTALPDDLRTLVASVPRGYAYGVWEFLERRYAGTELATIAEAWEQWSKLEQQPGERFDEYKARLDATYSRLKRADDAPSHGQYMYQLLWKLQPEYDAPLAALRVGGKTKDPKKIDWDEVTLLIQDHERTLTRRDQAPDGTERAFAARVASGGQRSKGSSGGSGATPGGARPPRDYSKVKCFICNQYGHTQYRCPQRDKQQQPAGDENSEGEGSGEQRRVNSVRQVASGSGNVLFRVQLLNRYALLSDEEDGDDAPPQKRAYVTVARAGAERDTSPERRPLRRLKRLGEVTDATPAKTNAPASDRASMNSGQRPDSKRSAKSDVAEERKAMLRYKKEASSGMSVDLALSKHAWGVDTMASTHCTGNKDLLTNLRRCAPEPIRVADGAVVTVCYKGTAHIRLKVAGPGDKVFTYKFDDVYFHERFDANLLSWGQLRLDGWQLHSDKELGTYLVTPGDNRIAASSRGRLTVLDGAIAPERIYAAMPCSSSRVTVASAEELVRLHARLGHVGYDRLIKMCAAGETDGVGEIHMKPSELQEAEKRIRDCVACKKGKMARPQFGDRGLDKGSRPGEILHMDTAFVTITDKYGMKRTEYWLIVVDPFSEARWMMASKTKTSLAGSAIAVVRQCQAMTGKKVRIVHTDNGTELANQEMRNFCRVNGSILSTSPARTPQLNGVAERNVRSFKDAVRTMLVHADAPGDLWEHAAQYQVYLWNRTRVARATKKTPFETLTNRKASVMYAGVFGCDAWVSVERSQREGTFAPKAEPAIYLGHTDADGPGATVLMVRTGKIERTRNVELREGEFSHMAAYDAGRGASVPEYAYGTTEDNGSPPPTSSSKTFSFKVQGGTSGNEPPTQSEHDAAVEEECAEPKEAKTYEFERILDHRGSGKDREYLVKWVGYKRPTWNPLGHFDVEAIVDYHDSLRQEQKPAPALRRSTRRKQAEASGQRTEHEESEDADSDDEPSTQRVNAVRVAKAALGCSRL